MLLLLLLISAVIVFIYGCTKVTIGIVIFNIAQVLYFVAGGFLVKNKDYLWIVAIVVISCGLTMCGAPYCAQYLLIPHMLIVLVASLIFSISKNSPIEVILAGSFLMLLIIYGDFVTADYEQLNTQYKKEWINEFKAEHPDCF